MSTKSKQGRRTKRKSGSKSRGRSGLAIVSNAPKDMMVKKALKELKINKRPEDRRWPSMWPWMPRFPPLIRPGNPDGIFPPPTRHPDGSWDWIPDIIWDGPDTWWLPSKSKPKPKPRPKKKKRKPLLGNEPARGTHPVHM